MLAVSKHGRMAFLSLVQSELSLEVYPGYGFTSFMVWLVNTTCLYIYDMRVGFSTVMRWVRSMMRLCARLGLDAGRRDRDTRDHNSLLIIRCQEFVRFVFFGRGIE